MATTMEGPPLKRPRGNVGAIVAYPTDDSATELRTSSLPSPTMQLSGHKGSVYAVEYSPSGATLLSCSFDKKCLLWSHTEGYHNFNVLEGHKNAVLDCAWLSEETVATASADKTVMLWDVETGTRLRKWDEHSGIVNAVTCIPATSGSSSIINSIFSASDDGSVMQWDQRQKSSVACFETEFPILGVAACASSGHVFSAGIDPAIKCWDVSMQRPVYAVKGHADTVTCLAVSPAGTHLLSNSMDQTVKCWDIQNFTAGNRLQKTLTGHKHNAERGLLKCSWSAGGNMVSAGSADKMVHVWDEFSGEELYLLPGHKGCVNAVTFHPVENVVVSAGSDKQIFVGELS